MIAVIHRIRIAARERTLTARGRRRGAGPTPGPGPGRTPCRYQVTGAAALLSLIVVAGGCVTTRSNGVMLPNALSALCGAWAQIHDLPAAPGHATAVQVSGDRLCRIWFGRACRDGEEVRALYIRDNLIAVRQGFDANDPRDLADYCHEAAHRHGAGECQAYRIQVALLKADALKPDRAIRDGIKRHCQPESEPTSAAAKSAHPYSRTFPAYSGLPEKASVRF